jgi:dTMP kinase
MLADALEALGVPVVRTREPGGTPVGERVREILLSGAPGELELAAEALLFAAARAELVARVVVPDLAEGRWVVSDRFIDSSLAYQGAARGLGIDTVLEINRIAVGHRMPDIALVIDVPVALATARRCATPDRIEAEGDGFLERVAAGYHELAARFPERVSLIDGEGSVDEVHERVIGELAELL